jgi:putative oxidoreductase
MKDLATTTQERTVMTTDNHPTRRSTALLWSAQIVLAVFFVIAAAPKLTGQHSAVHMFGEIGAGQWLRYLVGAAELAGGIGLLIPRLAGLAAAGLAADMTGATIINIAVVPSAAVALTLPLCLAFAVIARKRWNYSLDLLSLRVIGGRSADPNRCAVVHPVEQPADRGQRHVNAAP